MMNEKDVVSKEQVISQMMQNWDVKKSSDQQIAGDYINIMCNVCCNMQFYNVVRRVLHAKNHVMNLHSRN